ncbi:MAG: GMC family oxidoreductase [Alphaproteobacteria bacterium]|nr:MAG: GMC family oxidoreductase [Alphaproteobacteria bacterium]
MSNYDFDIIVVGSGMSGGWAAKEFSEKGFKTLVLDRGKPLEHGDYPTESMPPWEMPNRGRVNSDEVERDYYMVKRCYAFSEYTKPYFINDRENPYEFPEDKPFEWIRSARVGGKSQLWHRQSYRWGEQDFEANARDGHGCDWPIRYDDVKPWYDYVERFAGISGGYENMPQLPDSVFQKPHEMTQLEKDARVRIEAAYPGRRVIMGRTAHLTEPTEEQLDLGRGQCQSRNECQRGCSWGGFFSSLAATLPAARRTGNMTLKPNAIVHSVLHDESTGKATGVRVIDTETKEASIITARVIFMCASTIATTQVLMNSRSAKYPNGIGNTSGVLGHYLMDHVMGPGAMARFTGYEGFYYKGRRPTGIYVPRFMNISEPTDRYLRGFGYQGGSWRNGWTDEGRRQGLGGDFKDAFSKPGDWWFGLSGFGEMLPARENHIALDFNRLDGNGMPIIQISCDVGENSRRMGKDMVDKAVEMLKAAGGQDIQFSGDLDAPGLAIHEVGTARMGRDPKDSYLNGFNQSHEVANLFVTDGAAFASIACQNPSLTFMALTARAADYAATQIQAGVL